MVREALNRAFRMGFLPGAVRRADRQFDQGSMVLAGDESPCRVGLV